MVIPPPQLLFVYVSKLRPSTVQAGDRAEYERRPRKSIRPVRRQRAMAPEATGPNIASDGQASRSEEHTMQEGCNNLYISVLNKEILL